LKKLLTKKSKLAGILLSVVALIAGLLPGTALAEPPAPSIYVNPPVVDNLTVSQTFSVNVMVNTAVPSRGASFSMNWDPAIIECTGITFNQPTFFYETWKNANPPAALLFWPMNPNDSINNTTGSIAESSVSIMGGPAGGPVGTGIMFSVQFRAKANGNTALNVGGMITDAVGQIQSGITFQGANIYVGGPAPLPDLTVTAKHEQWVNQANKVYSIHYTVKNIGSLAAGASTTKIMVDGVQLVSDPCPALAPGAEYNGVASVNATMSGSDDVIVVIADSLNAIAEANEGNNSKTNTFALVSDAGSTIIDASFGAFLDITPPANILNAVLSLGQNSASGTLNVKCNTNWECKVSDENPATGGHMTDWNGTSYGSTKLINPMVVECDAEGTQVVLPGPGVIANGTVSGQSGNSGENFTIDFNQELEYADPMLPAGHSYHIVVTFTAAVTI